MLRKSPTVFRRIPAIIMIQNSETDGAAYLGHFQKSLLNTDLRLVHFKMFNKDHLRLLPQCLKVSTMRGDRGRDEEASLDAQPTLYCTHTDPSSLSPSLATTPRGNARHGGVSSFHGLKEFPHNSSEKPLSVGDISVPSLGQQTDPRTTPSSSESSALPSCVMTPCDASCEDKLDYHVVGVISLGGPMSAADDENYPFIQKVITLMKSAVEEDVPVLGICLGSQMLSRALGGEVTVAPISEMGFVPQVVEECASYATPENAAAAKARGIFDWFGGRRELLSYHWHGDTFSIPSPAVRIATGAYCANQAFQVPHKYVLGVQWHPDIDNRKAYTWMRTDGVDKRPAEDALTPGIVSCGEFRKSLEEGKQMCETQKLADDIFSKWFEGVERCRVARMRAVGAPSHDDRDPVLSPELRAYSAVPPPRVASASI